MGGEFIDAAGEGGIGTVVFTADGEGGAPGAPDTGSGDSDGGPRAGWLAASAWHIE